MSTFKEITMLSPYNSQDKVLELFVDTNGDGYILENVIELIGTYTFSIWIKGNKNSNVVIDILGTSKAVSVTTQWQKISYIVDCADLTNKNIFIMPELNTTTYFYEGFLSQGNLEQSWLPAPEDEDDKLTSIRSEIVQTAESIEQKITASDGRITSLSTTVDGITGRIENAEGKVTTIEGTVNGLKTSVKDAEGNISTLQQTSKEHTQSISNINGDISQVRQDVGSVTTEVANARGDKSSLSVRINGIQSQVSDAKGDISNIDQKANNIQLSVNSVRDDLTNKYYTKVETDSKFTIEPDKIVSTVQSQLYVGGKNLLLKSGEVYINSTSPTSDYRMTDKMEEGVDYTCTIWGDLGYDRQHFELRLDGSNIILGTTTNNNNGSHTLKFKGKANASLDHSTIYVYPIPTYSNSTNTIRKIKLEKGNVGTDWSPAPDEYITNSYFDKILNDKENGIVNQLSNAKSTIRQLQNSLSTLVVDKNNESLMQQKGDGWEFNIRDIQNGLSNAANGVAQANEDINTANQAIGGLQGKTNTLEKKTAVIEIKTYNGQPAIILGQKDSAFKLRITNTSIDFLDGAEKVAYISNQVLYITKSIIKDEIKIGDGVGWIWKRRENGNLGLRYMNQ